VRQDIALFIYAQLVVKEEKLDIELTETAFPEKQFSLNNVGLKEGDGTFIVFKDGRLVAAGQTD